MEERLKQLKDGLDGYLAVENKFTENQKVKIRNAIAKKRRKNRGRYFQADWMKQGLSIAVACSLLIGIGTFAYINFDGSDKQSMSMDKAAPITNPNAAADSSAKMAEAQESTVQQYDFADKINLAGEATPINESILPLSEKMQELYNQFQANPDQELLRGLEPYQVMQLYLYASTQQDYDTQYEFYIKDERTVVPPKEEFLADLNKHPETKEKAVKQNYSIITSQIIQPKSEVDYWEHAIIEFKDTQTEHYTYFTLLKNNDGIWTVSWTPIQ